VAAIHYISLFSGVGGLDLGLQIALPEARCVCYVESGIQNARVLEARITDGALDDAPIWSDVRTFDGRAWRGRVQAVIGGFPCQDLSVAGKREGIEGARSGLWAQFHRIIREVRPDWVFVENVAGLLVNRAMGRVLGDLAEERFDAEWGVFSAAECGAPHRRERVFILAYRPEMAERRILPTGMAW
jgi:DNA (cytosine-5)-methyltransferase 1